MTCFVFLCVFLLQVREWRTGGAMRWASSLLCLLPHTSVSFGARSPTKTTRYGQTRVRHDQTGALPTFYFGGFARCFYSLEHESSVSLTGQEEEKQPVCCLVSTTNQDPMTQLLYQPWLWMHAIKRIAFSELWGRLVILFAVSWLLDMSAQIEWPDAANIWDWQSVNKRFLNS